MKIGLWQLIGIVGTLGILISIVSYYWGHTEGKLEILLDMFEAQMQEVFKDE